MATTRSTLTRLALVGVLAAGGVGVYVATRADDATPAVAASIFKTATVEEGSLGTSEQIDGSVVLSDVTTVLHRIEGQTSSSVNSSSTSNSSSAPVGERRTDRQRPRQCHLQQALTRGAHPRQPHRGRRRRRVRDANRAQRSPAGPATTSTTEVPTTTPDTTDTRRRRSPRHRPHRHATTPVTDDAGDDHDHATDAHYADCTTTSTTTPAEPAAAASRPAALAAPAVAPAPAARRAAAPSGSRRWSRRSSPTAAQSALGTVLYSVESSPVVAMAGSQPAWRTLDTSSDDGIDIMQLEMSLVALGYDPDGTMTVDTHFDSDTKAVVKAWQEGYGIEVTGVVDLGSVVFVGADITVTGTDVVVGDEVGDGDAILSLSAASQQVVIDVPDGDEAYLVPGLVVKIGSGEGTVTLLRSIERDGAVVVQAVITPTGEIEGANNGSTVTVTIALQQSRRRAAGADRGLVSRIDGSYAVQVLADDGTSSFVAVELLGVSGSSAAIRGDGIEAGTQVLQPV